jgi:1-acyl-sn-glycerol-3-phosphate acyltransferase
MEDRERFLTEVNQGDVLSALGVSNVRFLHRPLSMLFRYPAREFARQFLAFDGMVEKEGFRAAAVSLLSRHVSGLTVTGTERIPRSGPLLLLSNHPGMTDSLALFASIPRDDLAIIAADRPVLRALAAASRSLIVVPDDRRARSAAVRRAIGHLKAGGALLTFPAGTTEPDPEVHDGALEALDGWSPSSALFVRLVPDLVVVPAVVRGVYARSAQHNPLTLLRRKPSDRQFLGAMLQVMAKILFPRSLPVHVKVEYLPPMSGRDLAPMGTAGAAERIRRTVGESLAPRRRVPVNRSKEPGWILQGALQARDRLPRPS